MSADPQKPPLIDLPETEYTVVGGRKGEPFFKPGGRMLIVAFVVLVFGSIAMQTVIAPLYDSVLTYFRSSRQ